MVLPVLVADDRRDRVRLDDQLLGEVLSLPLGLGRSRLVGIPDGNQFCVTA